MQASKFINNLKIVSSRLVIKNILLIWISIA
ncbi:hypothetical protein [Borreliella lanei]